MGEYGSDDAAMQRHYLEADEGSRLLRSGHSRLELLRTRELLTRYLPPAPARILDIGGGTGVHAGWLADRGYHVHLIDPVAKHVAAARTHGGFSATFGDARALDEPDASADAALLLGPLYHLVAESDRHVALREAHRVLRPGGLLLAAAISRYMALLDWAAAGRLTEDIAARLKPGLRTGHHDPTLGFTSAYFHTPAELRREVASSGFVGVDVIGIEGPAWPAVDAADAAREPELVESALICARTAEGDDDALASMSGHLLAVART